MFFCILLYSRQLCETKCIFSEGNLADFVLIHTKPNEEMHFVEESDADSSAQQVSAPKGTVLMVIETFNCPQSKKSVLIAGRKEEQILGHLKPSFSVTAN
ncbi:hypothetical protein Patl1_03327 [Pistacia atlantica]|uniref:Uncharacterized protein n=1 Tax=Pistacia atlantica TaxID=434234 RepID=A0ACC1C4G5_9ROSI|nr:hypothetical protein Patl1_03327 [Pistacia atlantica]